MLLDEWERQVGAAPKGFASQAKESRLHPGRGGRPQKDFSDEDRCVRYEAKPAKEGHKEGRITKVGGVVGDGQARK